MSNVGLDDILSGTLEHVLVSRGYRDLDLYLATTITDRLLAYAQNGAEFYFATTAEISASQWKQGEAQRKAKSPYLN